MHKKRDTRGVIKRRLHLRSEKSTSDNHRTMSCPKVKLDLLLSKRICAKVNIGETDSLAKDQLCLRYGVLFFYFYCKI